MKKAEIKVNDTYEINGNFVIISRIENGNIYAADPIFNDDGDCITGYDKSTECILTDCEIKNLK